MKQLLKKRWHRVPVALISAFLMVGLLTGGVFAALPATVQPVTQGVVMTYDYGTITANAIELPNVKVGDTRSKTFPGAVVVELGVDAVSLPGALKMVCDADPLYDSFDVTITLTDKPAGSTVGLYGYGISAGGEVSIDLDVAGTYTFDQTIEVTAGSIPGPATSTITFTLIESTTPPH